MISKPVKPAHKVPRTLHVAFSVQKLAWRIWFNQMARALGGRRRACATVTGLASAAVGMAWWLADQGDKASGGSALLQADTATTISAIIFTLPAMAAILARVYLPPDTLIAQMLTVFPLQRGSVRAAASLSVLGLSLGLGGFLLTTLAIPIGREALKHPAVPAAVILLVLLGATSALVIFESSIVFLGRCGLDGALGQGISGLACAALYAALFVQAMPVNHHLPRGIHAYLGGPLLRAAIGVGVWSGWLLVPILILATMCLFIAITWAEPHGAPGKGRSPFSRTGRALGLDRSLYGLEILQIVRFPSNLVMLVMLNGIGLVLAFASLRGSADRFGMSALFLMMISSWGVGGYGATHEHHWIYKVTGQPSAWVVPKILAVSTIWGAMVVVHSIWLLSWGGWMLSDLLSLVPSLFAEVCLAVTVGLCAPVDRNSTVSGAFAEIIAVIVLIVMTAGMQQAMAVAGSAAGQWAIQAAIVLACLLLYFYVAQMVGRQVKQ